jgi:hypothetical protein
MWARLSPSAIRSRKQNLSKKLNNCFKAAQERRLLFLPEIAATGRQVSDTE